MPAMILLISLLLTVPSMTKDLGTAGVFSGFGQGIGRGFEHMQSGSFSKGSWIGALHTRTAIAG